MIFQFIDKSKKKKIINGFSIFGIEKIDGHLIKWGSERLRVYTGTLTKDEIYSISRFSTIEGIGLYVGKDFINKKTKIHEYRLTVDSILLWKDKINKNIVYLDKEQEYNWFLGNDIDITNQINEAGKNISGFIVLKSKEDNDFIGMGKITQNMLYNFLPKERRIKRTFI